MTFARFVSLLCGRITKEITFLRECYRIHKWVLLRRVLIPTQYSFNTNPRYGYGKPVHDGLKTILEANRDQYIKHLENFLTLTD